MRYTLNATGRGSGLPRASMFAATTRPVETALVVPRHSGILLTCDSVQSWETTEGCSFLGGLMARAMGCKGRACIGPGWRKMTEPKDGTGFAPDFRELLGHEFKHLMAGHDEPLLETAKTDLSAAVTKAYGPLS